MALQRMDPGTVAPDCELKAPPQRWSEKAMTGVPRGVPMGEVCRAIFGKAIKFFARQLFT